MTLTGSRVPQLRTNSGMPMIYPEPAADAWRLCAAETRQTILSRHLIALEHEGDGASHGHDDRDKGGVHRRAYTVPSVRRAWPAGTRFAGQGTSRDPARFSPSPPPQKGIS